MPCLPLKLPDLPDLPDGIGLSAPLPGYPAVDANICCKQFALADFLPPIPPSIGVAIPVEVLATVNGYKDAIQVYLRKIQFDCPKEEPAEPDP